MNDIRRLIDIVSGNDSNRTLNESVDVSKNNIEEIEYSNNIADSSHIIQSLIPKNSKKLGVVDHRTVYRLNADDCFVYYLYDDDKNIPLTYIITEKNLDKGYYPLRQAEKCVDTPGVAMALLQFLRHIGIKLMVRVNEPLTLKGITWLSKMIETPRGLKIHDGSGRSIDLKELWNEWHRSRQDYDHTGKMSVYIESNENKSKSDYCFEDQTHYPGLLKNPLRYIGDTELDYDDRKVYHSADISNLTEQKLRVIMKGKQIHSDLKPKLMGLSFNDLEKLSESAGNDYIKFHKNISKKLELPQHKGLVSNTLNLYSVYRKQKIYESKDKSLSDIERALFSAFNSRAKSTIDSVKQGDSVSLLMLNTLSIPNDKVFANLQGFLAPKQIKSITNSNGIDYLHFVDGTRFPETDKNDPIHLAQSWAMTKLFDSYDSASRAYMTYALEGKKLSKQIEFVINVDDKEGVAEEKLVSPKYKPSKCSKCGGPSYSDEGIAEAKDACYYKVKSRYKVWPSAYSSGALVQCRRVGAKNWGNKSKK